MDTKALLGQLKDVHLPNGVSIFPLAVGWYILIIIITVLISLIIWKWVWKAKHYKKQTYTILAEIELNRNPEMLSQISLLIKRVALTRYPKEPVHTLFGEKWLQFLDKTGKTTDFTHGYGRTLLNIYQTQQIDNPDQLFTIVRKWLGKVL